MKFSRAVVPTALVIALGGSTAVAAQPAEPARRTAPGAVTDLDLGADVTQRQASLLAALEGDGRSTARATTPGVVSTVPEITAPTEGATVSGVVPVTVSSTAATVELGFDGDTWQVPVVDGTASSSFEAWGRTGAHALTATDCDVDGCGTADSVSVTVSNPALQLTQPTAGTEVGTSVVAVADATGGGVRFLLDGSPAGQVAGAPYQATIDTSSLTPGSHTLAALQCDEAFTTCEGPTPQTVSINVRNQLEPQLTGASPTLFSPNGDGTRDTTTLSYVLETRQDVTWRVTDTLGDTVRGPVDLGSKGAGTHEFVFDGKAGNGDGLPNGGYTVHLDTSKVVGGTTVTGQGQRGIVVDRTAPQFGSVGADPSTFFPVRDNYKDETKARTRLYEEAASLKLEVVNGRGKVVRVVDEGGHPHGKVTTTWNGRTKSGDLVPAGTYRLRYVAKDAAGNRRTSDVTRVTVSDKRLVKKSDSRTLAPKSSASGTIIGGCSAIFYPARRGWKASLSYRSNYNACSYPSSEDLLAFTQHTITVPSAIRYGSFKVNTYGGRTVAGFPDKGFMFYEHRSGDLINGATLRPSLGWHGGQSVKGKNVVTNSGKFRWLAGTWDGYWYDVKTFKVSYSYFVLR